ncbi:MAG TPA: heavy metal translocating P-type ATPase [Actinomycetota bacterium]|nr:heavy metal translocating P-type ATPase [Actinomycetota bacterium]
MRDHGSHGVADQDVAEKHAQHGHHAPAPAARGAHVTSSHDRHAGHSVEMFRNRFWISLALTIPVLLYAQMLWDWAGVDMPDLPAQKVVPFLLGTVVYVYGGSVFVRSAAGELRSRMPGMMTLVALGITTAYVYSAATTFLLEGEGFYWELATLVDVMLLGHWIEMRSIGRARGALGELAKLLPDTAERVTEHGVEEVPASALSVEDVVLVRPGGRVPADGEVVEGSSHVDESMLTGESRPVAKAFGDVVVAGSVNGEGSLRARVTKTGEETALAGIARLVAEAEASKSRAQALADRAASLLTYVAIAAGGATALVWAIAGRDVQFVIERTVTVIVIACPHALGLAVPLVIAIATGLSARSGILVRDRLALERARELDVVVFDKTGTLTKGELGVVGLVTTGDLDEGDALALAAGLESDSEHPLARAIVGEAGRRGLAPVGIEDFQAASGRGVEGRVGGRIVRLGGPKLLEELGVGVPEELGPEVKAWADEGKTVVYLIDGDAIVAAFALADSIREESREAVQALREMGMRVAMITGDSEAVAAWVARELEIEEVFAQVLPEHKAARVKELQERGLRVAMIGDGVNDAPALVQADVGIAIGAGTDVAIEAADVILVRDDPRDVVGVVGLSRASYRKMLQNLAWATGYNVVALPLAAGVLEPVGVTLSPAVGALLMALSTVVVSLNAQLLRRVRLAAEE